ncbi:MAG: XRE family transcriptional regulator [Chloroflexi bacterium]|nr:XRE family transcriptional regulator [Chloroflexota bacterium]MCY4247563.1 XRE family transcriptional regulator [Chloroflexota bacterium]
MIGARLKQARMLAGMTQQQLADAVQEAGFSVTKQAISKYENEKSFPSARYLLLASSVLDVPGSYFTHQPETEVRWSTFRRQSGFGKREQEAIMAYASDLAELQVELHSLLYPNAKAALPKPVPVCHFEDAERQANRLRRRWDVGDRPLDNLVQTAEDRGLIVISWDDKSGQFDGLSGWRGDYPVTVVNQNRSADRIRFTLAHEIGHLVMDTSNAVEDEEKLAHRFAAALLVPAEHALRELGNNRFELDWQELKTLKRKYGMSMAAWLGRARDLGIINNRAYKNQFIELSKRGWRKDEPGEYLGDEEPLQIKQMAQRAVAEGLISPDRMAQIGLDVWEAESEQVNSEHLTVYDLMAMPGEERNAAMERAFKLAAEDDFEIFEAYEVFDDYDEEFDAEVR